MNLTKYWQRRRKQRACVEIPCPAFEDTDLDAARPVRVETSSLMLDAIGLPWIKCDDRLAHASHRWEPEELSLAFCPGVAE